MPDSIGQYKKAMACSEDDRVRLRALVEQRNEWAATAQRSRLSFVGYDNRSSEWIKEQHAKPDDGGLCGPAWWMERAEMFQELVDKRDSDVFDEFGVVL